MDVHGCVFVYTYTGLPCVNRLWRIGPDCYTQSSKLTLGICGFNAYGVDFGCCFTCNGNAKVLIRGTATVPRFFYIYTAPKNT